jgi:hypothetical protein
MRPRSSHCDPMGVRGVCCRLAYMYAWMLVRTAPREVVRSHGSHRARTPRLQLPSHVSHHAAHSPRLQLPSHGSRTVHALPLPLPLPSHALLSCHWWRSGAATLPAVPSSH